MKKPTDSDDLPNDIGDAKVIGLHEVTSPDHHIDSPADEKSPTDASSPEPPGCSSRAASCWFHFRQMKIELVMFLYMFSYMVRGISSTSMILDKVCLTHLNYSSDICSNLSGYKDIKDEVEKMATNYHLGHSLIQILPSAILGCVIGPWSDKYGRKLPMIVAFIGITIDGFGTTLCAYYTNSRVEYYYIPAIFTGLSGGFVSIMTVVYSYVSDISTSKARSIKYAFMELAMGAAIPTGSFVGGWVYKMSKSYVPVFLISTAGHFLGMLFTVFLLKETRGIGNTDSWRTKLKLLRSTEAFMDSFRATMKQRPHQGRKQILLLLGVMSVIVLTQASVGSMMFMYVHHQYNWDNPQFSTVSAVYSVFGIVAMLITVPLLKRFRAGDPTLGIIGTVSLILKTIGVGLAEKPGVYYLANLFGLLQTLASLAPRTRISKVVSKNDLGKVFSFVTTSELLGPIIATIVFSQVFNATLSIYPGMMFLICGGMLFFALGVYIWLACLPAVNYEEMQENGAEADEAENAKNEEKEKSLIV